MSEPRVTRLVFDSAEGTATIVIERYPEPIGMTPIQRMSQHRPIVGDLPPDLAEALQVWLAGNQPP